MGAAGDPCLTHQDAQLSLPSRPLLQPGWEPRALQCDLCNAFSHLTLQSVEHDRFYKDIINVILTKEQTGF